MSDGTGKATVFKSEAAIAGDPRGWHPVWAWECQHGESDVEVEWGFKDTHDEALADLREHFREEHR